MTKDFDPAFYVKTQMKPVKRAKVIRELAEKVPVHLIQEHGGLDTVGPNAKSRLKSMLGEFLDFVNKNKAIVRGST